MSGCGCENPHIINKNGNCIIVLNRVVGQKHSCFTIVPIKVWESFRSLPKVEYEQRKVAHGLRKSHTNAKVAFMDLRKFHYNVLCRSEMKNQVQKSWLEGLNQ